MVDHMDQHRKLECSICTEYFIKATRLKCSHVFCNFCINQWMHVKKTCPYCRAPITSHKRTPAVDRFTQNLIDQLGDDEKNHRADLIRQRRRFAAQRSTSLRSSTAVRWSTAVHGGTAAFNNEAAPTEEATIVGATAARAGAAVLTGTEISTTSAVLRRAAALARATVSSGVGKINKSAVLRKAAALTRAVALTGAHTLARSAFPERAAITKRSELQSAHMIKSINHLRITATRMAAEAKKIASQFRVLAASSIAALTKTRNKQKIKTKQVRPSTRSSTADTALQALRQDLRTANNPLKSGDSDLGQTLTIY